MAHYLTDEDRCTTTNLEYAVSTVYSSSLTNYLDRTESDSWGFNRHQNRSFYNPTCYDVGEERLSNIKRLSHFVCEIWMGYKPSFKKVIPFYLTFLSARPFLALYFWRPVEASLTRRTDPRWRQSRKAAVDIQLCANPFFYFLRLAMARFAI
jgi:hypothetical protein